MGKVDTALRFGQYNSYELDAGEELWTSKFEVEFYSEIAIQIQAIQPDGAVTGEIIVRWIGADGGMLHDTAKAFTPAARWTKQVYVVDVPVGAKHAMWAVKNTHGSNKLNFACGMAEPGSIAGAFDPSLVNMVSMLDAYGLYTGVVTANQVRTGLLEAIAGKAWFDLDAPEIVMIGDNGVKWQASPENPFSLTDASGKLIGGLAHVKNVLQMIAGALTNDPESGYYGIVGTWTMPAIVKYELPERELSGMMFFAPNKSTPVFALGTRTDEYAWFELNVGSELVWLSSEDHMMLLSKDAQITMSGDPYDMGYGIDLSVTAANGHKQEIQLGGYIDEDDIKGGNIMLQVSGSGLTPARVILDTGEYSENLAELSFGNRGLGVDASGAYKRTGTTKTRL